MCVIKWCFIFFNYKKQIYEEYQNALYRNVLAFHDHYSLISYNTTMKYIMYVTCFKGSDLLKCFKSFSCLNFPLLRQKSLLFLPTFGSRLYETSRHYAILTGNKRRILACTVSTFVFRVYFVSKMQVSSI